MRLSAKVLVLGSKEHVIDLSSEVNAGFGDYTIGARMISVSLNACKKASRV